jgi:hypothetical protein
VLKKDTKCPNEGFYVWLVDIQSFVLYSCWKRDSLQITLLLYICSTWGLFERKMRFEPRITRNYVNGECWFHLSYLITLMAYLCSKRTPNVQIKFLMFDFRSRDHLCLIRAENLMLSKWWYSKGLPDMKHDWTKNTFWDVNNKKWRKWCKFVSPFLFNNTYGLPVLTMDTTSPNQVFYVCLVDL